MLSITGFQTKRVTTQKRQCQASCCQVKESTSATDLATKESQAEDSPPTTAPPTQKHEKKRRTTPTATPPNPHTGHQTAPQQQQIQPTPPAPKQGQHAQTVPPQDIMDLTGEIQHAQGQEHEHFNHEETESSEDDEDPHMALDQAIQAHTIDLTGGINMAQYAQPISTPIFSQIPHKLQKRIWAHKFVDLAQLLPSSQQHQTSTSQFTLTMKNSTLSLVPQTKSKRIDSIQTWTAAFLRFVSIYASKFPFETPALMKYMELVRDLALKRPGSAFIYYDSQFRMLRENVLLPWDQIHTEFWLLAFTMDVPIQLTNQPFRTPPTTPISSRRPAQNTGSRFLDHTCWRFNSRGQCGVKQCPHPHICGYCRGSHSATECTSHGSLPTSAPLHPTSHSGKYHPR